MASTISISTPALSAEISATGAELIRLQDHGGADLLWDGNPAFWNGRSPLLFPWSAGPRATAPRSLERHTSSASMVSPAPRSSRWFGPMLLPARGASKRAKRREQRYPFEFRLDVTYRIEDATLHMEAEVTNTNTAVMPASFGFHPALRWPLPYGKPRAAHEIVFEKEEPAPIRRPVDGLLSAVQFPTPVRDRHLGLRDGLFEEGALVWDTLASRSVLYGDAIRVDFPRMPHLGIWTKPGAGYVCIEPWQGYASPEGFDGELADKPGMVAIAPGATETFAMSISVLPRGS